MIHAEYSEGALGAAWEKYPHPEFKREDVADLIAALVTLPIR